jgi:hypothetical protein
MQAVSETQMRVYCSKEENEFLDSVERLLLEAKTRFKAESFRMILDELEDLINAHGAEIPKSNPGERGSKRPAVPPVKMTAATLSQAEQDILKGL